MNTQNILNKLERELISTATSSSLECMSKRCSDCDKSHLLRHVCRPPEHHSLHSPIPPPFSPQNTLPPLAHHTIHNKSLTLPLNAPRLNFPFPMDIANKPLTLSSLYLTSLPPPTPHPHPLSALNFPPPPPPSTSPPLGSVSSF